MRVNKVSLGLLLGLSGLLLAHQAGAEAWCKTRNKCNFWGKKYTANARVGCFELPLPLCWHHQGHCDSASASCGWNNCPISGGASASASNNSGGCVWTINRTGTGVAGTPPPTPTEMRDDDAADSRLESTTEFDDARQEVTIRLKNGTLAARPGGLAQRIDVYVFREDVRAGVEVEDPVRTPENTLWHGSIVLAGGRLAVVGFSADAFATTVEGKETVRVSIADARALIPFRIGAADFEKLVVEVGTSEEAPAK
jgi:hypothetical protein